MEWISAGFFWVTDARAPVRAPTILPASIVTVNRHGLLDDDAAALAAAEYANRDDAGTEPVTWYPWRVDEHEVADRD